MYQVLYRKWRPKSFFDVVGQEQVTLTLENELKSNRISHAYIFTGSKGTGKTTCAKILAKAINCVNIKNGNPCNECEICKGIDNGSILDVIEIDAASNNGVENIRGLRQEANFIPATAKYRVYIIDEVHMLSIGAFNALLKILEEPPEHVVFILATTEIHKIPATILSRCQRFNFNRIPINIASERLKYICKKENKIITDEAAFLIAKLSDGALRDALSILDQCICKSSNVTIEIVKETVGLSGQEHLTDIVNCILNKNCENVLNIINNLYAASKDMKRLCFELIEYFRNLMLIKIMKQPNNILIISKEDFEIAKQQASNFSLEEIIHILNLLQNSFERMSLSNKKKFEIEICLIKLCSDNIMNNIKKQTSTAQNCEKEKSKNDSETITKNDTIKDTKIIKNNEDPTTTNDKNNELKNWSEILKTLKINSHVLATSLKDSKAYVEGNKLFIDTESIVAFDFLKKPIQRDNLISAIKKVTGNTYNTIQKYIKEPSITKEDPLNGLVEHAKKIGIPIKNV